MFFRQAKLAFDKDIKKPIKHSSPITSADNSYVSMSSNVSQAELSKDGADKNASLELKNKNKLNMPLRWMGHDQTTVQTAPQLPKPDPHYKTKREIVSEDVDDHVEDQQDIKFQTRYDKCSQDASSTFHTYINPLNSEHDLAKANRLLVQSNQAVAVDKIDCNLLNKSHGQMALI